MSIYFYKYQSEIDLTGESQIIATYYVRWRQRLRPGGVVTEPTYHLLLLLLKIHLYSNYSSGFSLQGTSGILCKFNCKHGA